MRGLTLIGVLALAGCATTFKPAEKADVVIAVSGIDEVKARLSRGIPTDPERADLALYFATDRTDDCKDPDFNPPRVFAFRGGKRVGDAWLLSGYTFMSVNGVWQAPPGKYAFRNLNIRWAGWAYVVAGDYDNLTATSAPVSLAFEMETTPLFLGQFKLSVDEQGQVALVETPTSPEVEAAAARQLGVATPKRPALSTRTLIRCAPTGGVKHEILPLKNETPTG